jgi:hypothetical protein
MFKKLVLPVLFVACAAVAARAQDTDSSTEDTTAVADDILAVRAQDTDSEPRTQDKDSSGIRHSFSFGMANPHRPEVFHDYWKPGFFVGFGVIEESPNGAIDFGGNGEIGYFGYKYLTYESRDLWLIKADLFTRFYIPSFKIPYVSVAGGLSMLFGEGESDDIDAAMEADDGSILYYFNLLLSAGAGLNIPIGSINVVIDIQYTMMFGLQRGYVAYWPVKLEIILPFSFFSPDK